MVTPPKDDVLLLQEIDEAYVESYPSEKSVSESHPFRGFQQKHLQSQQGRPHNLQSYGAFWLDQFSVIFSCKQNECSPT